MLYEVITEEAKTLGEELKNVLCTLPNILSDEVPEGTSEEDNVEVRRFGEPKQFDFKPLEHDEIGTKLGLIDFENAAKLSGARFVVLKGAVARLERAIAQLMLDTHTMEGGYTEMNVPVLVHSNALYGTGQLPKFAEDLFRTEQGHCRITS